MAKKKRMVAIRYMDPCDTWTSLGRMPAHAAEVALKAWVGDPRFWRLQVAPLSDGIMSIENKGSSAWIARGTWISIKEWGCSNSFYDVDGNYIVM